MNCNQNYLKSACLIVP